MLRLVSLPMRRFLIDNLLPDQAAAAPSVSTMSARGKEIRRSRWRRENRLHRLGQRRRKSFVLQYRAGRRSRRMVLGYVNVVTPEQARTMAIQYLAALRQGIDPLAE